MYFPQIPDLKQMSVPSLWLCAENDFTFPAKVRNQAMKAVEETHPGMCIRLVCNKGVHDSRLWFRFPMIVSRLTRFCSQLITLDEAFERFFSFRCFHTSTQSSNQAMETVEETHPGM